MVSLTDQVARITFPSLPETLNILSIEYAEDVTFFSKDPHHWLIVRDEKTGIMGGMCLTPSSFQQGSSLLAQFCRDLGNNNKWVGSHFFCWVPRHFDEKTEEEVEEAVNKFYGQVYAKFTAFCAALKIKSVWMILLDEPHQSLLESGRFPFEVGAPFNYQNTGYVAALLPVLTEGQRVLRSSHINFSQTKFLMN